MQINLQIYDEVLVNAADNKRRDESQTFIKVTLDQERGSISIHNDGKTVPVVKHVKENMLIPQLIFGNLLTGSNYNDDKKKLVGGV